MTLPTVFEPFWLTLSTSTIPSIVAFSFDDEDEDDENYDDFEGDFDGDDWGDDEE